jgi:hypothetical protein
MIRNIRGTTPASRPALRRGTAGQPQTSIDLGSRPPEPCAQVRILLGALCDLSGDRNGLEPTSGFGVFPFAGCAGRGSGGLVIATGVEGELAEELAGGGVDDADVQVADEHEDVGSGVGPADADVVVNRPGISGGSIL